LREWLAILDKVVGEENREPIVAVLRDAVPEFKAGAA